MKPFILILLLISTGILFSLLFRPVEVLATLGRQLQQIFRFPTKSLAPVVSTAFDSSVRATFHPSSGDTWRQVTHF